MSAPLLLKTVAELRAWRRDQRGRVGFVPTMGALHAGHAKLLDVMRACSDQAVLSIFVNPTQFGPTEDLARYPRTLEQDLEIARQAQVDAVFFPTPEQMYPPGYSTYVEEQVATQPLCGAVRPGHFRGVTTVVLKLLNLVQPRAAYFGLKDAQQFFALHKMAQDLDLDVSIEGVPTVRETDGLAMSSRNRYLAPQERELAPALYAELKRVAAAPGELPAARARLESLGFKVQYFEHVRLPDLTAAQPDQPSLLAIAAYLGTTRLIDNVILQPERLEDVRIHSSRDYSERRTK